MLVIIAPLAISAQTRSYSIPNTIDRGSFIEMNFNNQDGLTGEELKDLIVSRHFTLEANFASWNGSSMKTMNPSFCYFEVEDNNIVINVGNAVRLGYRGAIQYYQGRITDYKISYIAKSEKYIIFIKTTEVTFDPKNYKHSSYSYTGADGTLRVYLTVYKDGSSNATITNADRPFNMYGSVASIESANSFYDYFGY